MVGARGGGGPKKHAHAKKWRIDGGEWGKLGEGKWWSVEGRRTDY